MHSLRKVNREYFILSHNARSKMSLKVNMHQVLSTLNKLDESKLDGDKGMAKKGQQLIN